MDGVKLIIRYTETRGGSRESHDVLVETDSATIGRGTDQTIQVPDRRIPLSHSVLTLSGKHLLLKAGSGHSFTVNERIVRSAELEDGDVVDILGHEFRILAGDDRADYIIEVEVTAENIEPLRQRFRTRLRELDFPERKISWLLFLGIVVISIVIPSTGFFIGMDPVRSSFLPDDGQWSTGDLNHTHAFTGDNCNFCHVVPFTPVRDEDCLSCHHSIGHHFDIDVFGSENASTSRCEFCHKEHGEKDGLTRTDQAICSDCHQDLAAAGLESDRLRPATDFLENHPDFRVTLTVLDENGIWQEQRQDLWAEDLQERSGLIFPHDLHLDREGINSADGKVTLVCADCHVAEKGGLNMMTVTMEDHCASCHELTFDPDTPDRVVPHGKPGELMQLLKEYYAWQFLNRGLDEPDTEIRQPVLPTTQRKARRPGNRKVRQDIATFVPEKTATEPVTVQAKRFIESRVSEAAANLFERQTCTICHEIREVPDQEVPWKVQPVRLTADWLPLSVFSHKKHKNMDCTSCHEAETSELASDVLMPDLASCQTCHGGEDAGDRLQSTCITCHEFHLEDQGSMGESLATQ